MSSRLTICLYGLEGFLTTPPRISSSDPYDVKVVNGEEVIILHAQSGYRGNRLSLCVIL